MEYEEITEKVIGCAFRVYNSMGGGFLESVYRKCMMIELKKAGLDAEFEKAIQVYYENEVVGEFVADIVVEKEIIVELKAVRQLVESHEVQLVNYLMATGKAVGLLVNFGERSVKVKREYREYKKPLN